MSHGYFHSENILHAADLLYIIDWEFVRYDHPSKDIGRLLSSIMKRHHTWDHTIFQNILLHYIRENSLNDWQLKLLFVDLSFPHTFCRFLEKRLYKYMSVEELYSFLEKEYGKTCYLLEHLRV
ncbi:phosphotransferase [Paenibacillus sp. FA6]|uniref:phosphotransferase n=1 Tax=Paenibacillus sp. FA6 TaxID=3413029 RepID=UPI003F6561C7